MAAERRPRGRWVVAIGVALVAATAFGVVLVVLRPSSAGDRRATSRSHPGSVAAPGAPIRIMLRPAVVLRGQTATITVTGITGSSPQVQLEGATTSLGHALPWTALRRNGTGWQATLPAPEFRGVYAIRLRAAPGARVVTSEAWLLRVFAKGTQARPLLESPEEVARSWVRDLPANAVVVAMRRWPLPAFDHRDPYLHQVLVIAYTVEGHRGVRDRLGIFVTAVRETKASRWRLLEATAAPQ